MKTHFLCLALILTAHLTTAQQLLVDFGADPASNTYNTQTFPGWEQVNISSTTHYLSINGISGTGMQEVPADSNQYSNFTCITGLPRQFTRGERIMLYWYNYTGLPFEFNPLISFTDADNPVNEFGEPQWFIVGLTENYWVEPYQTIITYYDVTDNTSASPMLPPSTGEHNLLNVCVNTFEPGLILDKIYIGQADTIPPGIPQQLQVTNFGAHSIDISWSAVSDNPGGDGFSHYEVLLNGLVFGISPANQFTAHLLEASRTYTIELRSVDKANNKSALSAPLVQSTAPASYPTHLINPAIQLDYLGAFKLPEGGTGTDFNYMESDLAYYPQGNPDNSDPYPGSLFVAGDATHRMVAEISIPAPLISPGKMLDDLPVASFLQDFADVSSPNIQYAEWGWKRGPALACLDAQTGQAEGYLYTCHGEYYAMDGERFNSYGACRTDLSAPQPEGGWFIGPTDGFLPPQYMTILNFIFPMPSPINGHLLVAGGSRPGNFHNGPSLVAFSPWNHGLPLPPNNTSLDYSALLLYDDDFGTNFLNGHGYCDYWYGGAWLYTAERQAVAVSGLKGRGREWYGYNNGESTFNVLLNVPTPIEPEDKGPRQSFAQAMLLFYDPGELALVANGLSPSWQPQPYAAYDPANEFFYPNDHTPAYISGYKGSGGMAYDHERQIIYLLERGVTGIDHSVSLVHAWKLESQGTSTNDRLQNHIKISYNGYELCISLALTSGETKVEIFNAAGKRLTSSTYQDMQHNCKPLRLAAGLYLVKVEHGGLLFSKKIIVSQ